ncbi:MAG: hypothetical protein ACI9YB_003016, partial [Halioglobus sp.]
LVVNCTALRRNHLYTPLQQRNKIIPLLANLNKPAMDNS